MGIHDIARLLIDRLDVRGCLFFIRVSRCKIRKTFLHILCDRITSICFQFFHQRLRLFRILASHQIYQSLQITGDQDVHGWRCGQHEFPILIIGSRLKEIKEHLIFIGGTDQLVYRNPHILCIICCQNISKITGRHYHIDLFAVLYLFVGKKLGIGIDIIDDLGNQPSDIDGISGGELISLASQFLCQLHVFKHGLDAALRIVKITVNRDYIYILSFLSDHLQFLHFTDAVLWIEYDNPCPFHIRKPRHRSLSGIS